MEVRPDRESFRRQADSAALIPLWTDVLCDGDTPVGVFARLRSLAPHPFLLESVVGGERWARYSFVGVGHRAHVTGRVTTDGVQLDVHPAEGLGLPHVEGEGLARVESLMRAYRARPAEGLPRFWGGLVGVWGHDFVRCLEHLPVQADRPGQGLPAFDLLASDTVVAFDNLSQRVQVVATACPATDGGVDEAYDRAVERMARVVERIRTGRDRPEPIELVEDVAFEARSADPWTPESYRASVRRGREYIGAGDVFQVVLSQRFDVPRGDLDALDVYRMLRVTNPSPYMYLLDLPSATLAGASPEVLVRVDRDSRRVTVRPIAGTRPRGDTTESDQALEQELLADPKERAEHLMLIDLGRNDVGRVSKPGSVTLDESFAIERYSRVMHIVSEVSGELRDDVDALAALRATFPAGTLSGAPKVRALEVIDELEPADRGWYGGAVGYLGYDGGADFAICIRSVVCHPDVLSMQAGAGIVHDSVPEKEDEECRNKASAVLRAIEMARAGRSSTGGAS